MQSWNVFKLYGVNVYHPITFWLSMHTGTAHETSWLILVLVTTAPQGPLAHPLPQTGQSSVSINQFYNYSLCVRATCIWNRRERSCLSHNRTCLSDMTNSRRQPKLHVKAFSPPLSATPQPLQRPTYPPHPLKTRCNAASSPLKDPVGLHPPPPGAP